MTRKQKLVLNCIVDFWTREGRSPSFAEIAKAYGAKSKSHVGVIVRRLKEAGLIDYRPGSARGIRLVSPYGSPAVAVAARRVLDGIKFEDPEAGYAIVEAEALGDLDIALAEASGDLGA